jgi:tetratricopeptide (TPR) repeat protein
VLTGRATGIGTFACVVATALALSAAGARAEAPHATSVERRIDDVASMPAEARIALFEAMQQREDGDPAGAAVTILNFLERRPDLDHFLVRFHLAVSHLQSGNSALALEEYRKSVELEPLFAQGWLNLGELAYNMGRFDAAADALLRGYEVSAVKEARVLYFAAASLVMDERPGDAVPHLETLVSGTLGEPELEWYRVLLMALVDLGDTERGRRTVDAMLDRFGDDPEAWRLAFRYSASLSDYREAAVFLTAAGYLSPLTAEERMTLGDLLLSSGLPAPASACYRETVTDDSPAQDLERLASAYLASYDTDSARAALERALEREPSSRLWSLLGDLCFMDDDHAGAYDAYAQCDEGSPEAPRAALMMGYCAIQLDRNDDAIAALERAAASPEQAGKATQLLSALRSLAPPAPPESP